MIDQILIDLDDVLNHFTMHALHMMGCFAREHEFPVEVGYDLPAAYNHLTGGSVDAFDFWHRLPLEIWDNMPRRDEVNWLLPLCEELVGRENVIICTASLGHPRHYSGKMRWIYRNLPNWTHRQVSITSMKHAYARPGCLLIDDSVVNVDKFRNTRGGQAILIPRPWNRLNPYIAKYNVQMVLKLLFPNTQTT